jgi:F0F1-type ATP synthase delta subunit
MKIKFNKTDVECKMIIDKDLLGGIKVQVGDTVIDSTLSGRINDMYKMAGIKPQIR